MPISEKKMQIVMNNYFKAECTVNTSIREAFEKGFRIGVQKGYEITKELERTAKVEQQETCWEDIRPYKEGMCTSCGRNVYDHAKYCDECGARLEWE